MIDLKGYSPREHIEIGCSVNETLTGLPPRLSSLLYFRPGTKFRFPRDLSRQGKLHEGSAMPHRNALDLDSAHNTAIRAEIGNRLRALLPKEQPSPSPRIQHSLDCLNALDVTEADLAIGSLSWRPLSY